MGSGRSDRDIAGWVGVRVLGAHGPLLAGVGGDHRFLEGTDLRLRRLGGRLVRNRDRRDSRPSRLLSVLAVPRAERALPGMRSFVLVAGAATASFCWYAAIKGAYLSTKFSSLIVERNLIYLTSLAFVATAVILERARPPSGRSSFRPLRSSPRSLRPLSTGRRPVPLLRGARTLDPRVPEPRAGLGDREDRDGRCRCRGGRRAAGAPRAWCEPARLRQANGHDRDCSRSSSRGTSPTRSTPRSASTTSPPRSPEPRRTARLDRPRGRLRRGDDPGAEREKRERRVG